MVVEVEQCVDGVDVIEVGFKVHFFEQVEIELEFSCVLEPEEVFEVVVVEDVHEELLEVGLDGFAIVA